ncbi:hypothetical protein [Pseudomonas sp. B22(2017)]|uniref:hypothetical protein n=1 Tax=Pseudomonas sp. B22(2017) TaxID=1981736 RepID=UPI000A200716|nr:hypothetical protein [Pseudomonas sp. B22(2017)]
MTLLIRFIIKMSRIWVQLLICFLLSGMTWLAVSYTAWTGSTISSLDRSTFITALGTIATLVALFCSLSISWILFVTQQLKGERLVAYDLMKVRLLESQRWLVDQPDSDERSICLDLAFELDRFEPNDLPITNRDELFDSYLKVVADGYNSEDAERRLFTETTVTYFSYVETLLNRIGLISIRQIISRLFIDTLAKGVALVGVSVLVLLAAMVWFGGNATPFLMTMSTFIASGSALLLIEVWVDLRRFYDEDLDFIQKEES